MPPPSVQIFDVNLSTPVDVTPSKTAPALSQPSQRIPMNIIENEDLAWGRFGKAVSDEDITVCYDMSLKDFEHFGIHDLFKVCILFCLVLITLNFSRLTGSLSLIFVGNVEVHCSV